MNIERAYSVEVAVRLANPLDANRLVELSEQLGYPLSHEEALSRLDQTLKDVDHVIYVAELDGRVTGWVHVYVLRLLITGLQAEIGGLVVDKNSRRCGAGRLLMQHAEEWARGKGVRNLYLRSNVIREGAHAFYKKLGYENFKTSLVFRKVL